MLSIGIRFGQGFDRMSALKVFQSIPVDYDYDLLVIGASPAGIACAREARSAGKKTAIIHWKEYTPAEKEGFDENMKEMAEALDVQDESSTVAENGDDVKSPAERNFSKSSIKRGSLKFDPKHGSGSVSSRQSTAMKSRKIRQSRLDLNNELFKRGKECVKLMQNAATLGAAVENAYNSGWRLCTTRPPLSMNWRKMTEEIMDHVMKKNYDLMNDLSNEGVEIIKGRVSFTDSHTVKVNSNQREDTVTAGLICIAPCGLYEFPKDVKGSAEFGISFDDFPRLSEPPGKTLIVGGRAEALECAGILACCRFPVTIITRKNILDGYDSEMAEMIGSNLKKKGAKILEKSTLKSVKMTKANNRLVGTFERENDEGKRFEENEEFDTVLFAVGKIVDLKSLELDKAEVEWEPESRKIKTNNYEETSAVNIYAVGDAVFTPCDCPEASELAGKLLGRRLFHNEEQLMDYSFDPIVIYAPIEYAFVGISEDSAAYRFGLHCVDVYHGFFQPLDFVLPPIKEKCFAKVIVFKSTNKIIGMHILGPGAGEIIQGFAAAVKNGLTMKTLQTIVAVPASNAEEFLKLKELKTHEQKVQALRK